MIHLKYYEGEGQGGTLSDLGNCTILTEYEYKPGMGIVRIREIQMWIVDAGRVWNFLYIIAKPF